MGSARFLAAFAAAISVVLLSACGDDAPGIAPGDAGGARDAGPRDGGSLAPGPDSGGSDSGTVAVECETLAECDDGDSCTRDGCNSSRCEHIAMPGCMGCRTDVDCDDGDPSTFDACETLFGLCTHDECRTAADCDDHDDCTGDECLGSGCHHYDNRTCCTRDEDCADPFACTIDSCSTAGRCQFTPTPACATCSRDFDADGAISDICGGDDCDDADPARAPGIAEDCDDLIDNDCDGDVDRADTDCAGPTASCTGAPALMDGSHVTGTVIERSTIVVPARPPCGSAAFYTLALATESDVTLTVRLHALVEGPPPCAGCEPSPAPTHVNYNVFLERTCGDPMSSVSGPSTRCSYWEPAGGFFGGSDTATVALRRVPAGTYGVEIQIGQMWSSRTTTFDFDLDVRATPSAAPTCSGAALVSGTPVTGTTLGAPDAFGTRCDDRVVDSVERMHPFTLAARQRVRLHASATHHGSPGTSAAPLRLAIYDACAVAGVRSRCAESVGGTCQPTDSLETVLDAGTYYALIEARDGGDVDYTLTLTTEDDGAACAGAPVIAASGSLMGTTVGGPNAFEWGGVCGRGSGPDRVYSLTITSRRRVVLDLIASYPDAMVQLVSGCGATLVAGDGTDTRLDMMLDPGSYTVVIDGASATDAGEYVLNATLL